MTLTAIVTGAGRGIGRETAFLFAKKGLNVAICSRTLKEIQDTANTIKKINPGVIGAKCDVSIPSQVESFVGQTARKFGGIDILINNAGVAFLKSLLETTEAQWDETLGSNLKSAFLCSKFVLPRMIERNCGVIINVSSGAGRAGFANLSAYCASKFGMMGLTESLAWEVAGHNIRVMAICPGEVATRMQEKTDPDYYEKHRASMIQPKAVAAKICEMALDARRYRNGESVDI
ncbi:MAG: SDR family oxidoreductase [Nitrososphaera sp.]|nr:SDR family oxidoreductase [Nitrososphaera sp.]